LLARIYISISKFEVLTFALLFKANYASLLLSRYGEAGMLIYIWGFSEETWWLMHWSWSWFMHWSWSSLVPKKKKKENRKET
jgi:hypothetical protein